ncbi:MAG: NAD(P)-binding protein, partial [Alphaproteobacteria bacterium]
VPHCTGMGFAMPETLAAMREVKAEGGWAVVCTEYCSIHPSSDDSPYPYASLWDEEDVKAQALMVEAVHRHGALAGVELWYGGSSANRLTREIPLGPTSRPVWHHDPVQTQAMDRQDIHALRRWQAEAAQRARRAGFDIVYVYAGHGYLPFQFISRRTNDRRDEYGGGLQNRVRLLREMIEDTKEAVGESCAVAVRLAVEELLGEEGVTAKAEGREVVEMLAELPDLWDVNISDFENDARSSRFVREGVQEPYVAWVKQVTSKPVVGVGRFTSPDAMVAQVRGGHLDMIGAARPSIADPFLPKKIEEGRFDDIRECIGCNICIIGDGFGVPIRCTQNPAMGEEWRRGWHPERIAPKGSDDGVLVVGAGPAGLECTRALGLRGYRVHLAEASEELGGRVIAEAALPGLAEWRRVRDYRVTQIEKMPNVDVYRSSPLTAEDILGFGFARVVLATGAGWRKDGVGRENPFPVAGWDRPGVYSPDEVMAGAHPNDPVVVFDDDHYFMGSSLAEKLREEGLEVTLLTPAAKAAAWTEHTLEQRFIQARLLELDIAIVTGHTLRRFDGSAVDLACVYTGRVSRRPSAALVMVTARLPNDSLYGEITAYPDALARAGVKSVTRIGDCLAPGSIAAAVHAGHLYARELDANLVEGAARLRRERATA